MDIFFAIYITIKQNKYLSLQRETKNKGIMKKMYVLIWAVMLMACVNESMNGGKNAIQFVREVLPEITKDAVSIDVVACDTVGICDIDSLTTEIELKEMDADAGRIRTKELREFAEQMNIEMYSDKRLLYSVAVKAKSTKTETVDVIMEKDGTTPYMLYDEYKKKRQPLFERVIENEVIVGVDDIEIR